MKAAQISEYGPVRVIKIVDIDKPQFAEGQVLVEVYAASINPFDTTVREGHVASIIKSLPITLGGDIAGVVVGIGPSVDNIKIGEKVYGQANVVAGNSGAFAEFAVTKADQIAVAPEGVGFEQAAALPLVGLSARQAITEHIKLQPNQKILIHGGAGGIGTVAIQLAKHIGAYVATTASGGGIEYVKKLGADEVIDYKNQKFEEILNDYDAVFDTVAGKTYFRSFKVLKKGGIIVSMLEQPDTELMEKYGVGAIAQQTRTTTEALSELAKLVEQGVVAPHEDKIYPLEQIREAFTARESGKVLGKVVIKIKD